MKIFNYVELLDYIKNNNRFKLDRYKLNFISFRDKTFHLRYRISYHGPRKDKMSEFKIERLGKEAEEGKTIKFIFYNSENDDSYSCLDWFKKVVEEKMDYYFCLLNRTSYIKKTLNELINGLKKEKDINFLVEDVDFYNFYVFRFNNDTWKLGNISFLFDDSRRADLYLGQSIKYISSKFWSVDYSPVKFIRRGINPESKINYYLQSGNLERIGIDDYKYLDRLTSIPDEQLKIILKEFMIRIINDD